MWVIVYHYDTGTSSKSLIAGSDKLYPDYKSAIAAARECARQREGRVFLVAKVETKVYGEVVVNEIPAKG